MISLRIIVIALLASVAWAGEVDRLDPTLAVPDIHGKLQQPFKTVGKSASVVFFITHDCPISNSYAREIHRICDAYSGISCALAYVDPTLTPEVAAKHVADYGHGDYPAIIDTKHLLVKAAGATITPEAVLVLPDGKIAYRGRIDDKYVSIGRARFRPTRLDLKLALDAVLAGRSIDIARTEPVGCFITPIEFFQKSNQTAR